MVRCPQIIIEKRSMLCGPAMLCFVFIGSPSLLQWYDTKLLKSWKNKKKKKRGNKGPNNIKYLLIYTCKRNFVRNIYFYFGLQSNHKCFFFCDFSKRPTLERYPLTSWLVWCSSNKFENTFLSSCEISFVFVFNWLQNILHPYLAELLATVFF